MIDLFADVSEYCRLAVPAEQTVLDANQRQVITRSTEFVLAELHDRSVRAELTQAHSYQQAVITAVPDVIHIYDVATKQVVRANRSATPIW